MSNYKYPWWPEVKATVRAYYAGVNISQEGRKAICKALRETEAKTTGQERKRLLQLLYGKYPVKMSAAAIRLHISRPTAVRWHGEFLRSVKKFFEIEKDEPSRR